MKIVRKIFKVFGALLFLVVTTVAIVTWYASVDKTDKFYLRDAELVDREFLTNLEHTLKYEKSARVLYETPSVYAHRLKKGDGIIFAYRWYSNGSLMAIDDEGFEKVTIWLPEVPSELIKEVDLSDKENAIAIYTKGGSAWPRAACSGFLLPGRLTIIRVGEKYTVSVAAKLKPEGVLRLNDWCREKDIEMEFITSEISHDGLTAWLGRPGEHPYDETYR